MINVLPINDLKEHTEDSTCECFPELRMESGEMILIHNSYDGMELGEGDPTEYGRYLCLFEMQTETGLSHFWEIVSWYNSFHDGDCWNYTVENGERLVRFFKLPDFSEGLQYRNDSQLVIQ